MSKETIKKLIKASNAFTVKTKKAGYQKIVSKSKH